MTFCYCNTSSIISQVVKRKSLFWLVTVESHFLTGPNPLLWAVEHILGGVCGGTKPFTSWLELEKDRNLSGEHKSSDLTPLPSTHLLRGSTVSEALSKLGAQSPLRHIPDPERNRQTGAFEVFAHFKADSYT